ncbi:YcaO-like family protein [Nonomuraea insulae]|uniref:YcaO-like family protein n=1 Tax=Nonomuraea insulae TaxID=1616787 RepID=A0ABW1CND1_9ACTN
MSRPQQAFRSPRGWEQAGPHTLDGGERTVPLAEAERRAYQALTHLGLSAHLTDLGAGGDPTAWMCELRHTGGHPAAPAARVGGKGDGEAARGCGKGDGTAARGCGKGDGEAARVGALYEALEHHLTGPARFDPAHVHLIRAADLLAGPVAGEAAATVLAGLGDTPVACHAYRPLRPAPGGAETLMVPLALSAPHYVDDPALRHAAGDGCDYAGLARYSCNSGSAIGVGRAEALVHALNESIERDAFSLLLARAFLAPPRRHRLAVVDPATLPASLAAAHARAEEVLAARVHLLDITTDLGVPAYLAYSPPTAERDHRRGAGASLFAPYAAWRALAELVQSALATAAHAGPVPRVDLRGLAPHPALYACGHFDLTPHLAHARQAPPLPAEGPAPDGPATHLDHLTRLLTATGHRPYHRIAAELPGDIVAVHTYVPGLERFMLITQGNLILPGARARAAAACGSPQDG